MQRRDAPQETEDPHGAITVFRNPSSVTTSSGGAHSIVEPNGSGVTYAQVVFPPDRRKPDDGSTSPKRLAVPANVPVHLLSESDVRNQLGNLKSFNAPKPEAQRGYDTVDTDEVVVNQPQIQPQVQPQVLPQAYVLPQVQAQVLPEIQPQVPEGVAPPSSHTEPIQHQRLSDEARPQSPETDF